MLKTMHKAVKESLTKTTVNTIKNNHYILFNHNAHLYSKKLTEEQISVMRQLAKTDKKLMTNKQQNRINYKEFEKPFVTYKEKELKGPYLHVITVNPIIVSDSNKNM